jgi:hypothetical protein
MNLGTHMPDGERRKPIDIEVCRTKVKITTSKKRTKRSNISFLRYCMEMKLEAPRNLYSSPGYNNNISQ